MANQKMVIVQEDRRIDAGKKVPIIGEWAWNERLMRAYFTLRELFVRIGSLKGKPGLVVDSRFAVPISPYQKYTDEELQKLTDLAKRRQQAFNFYQHLANRESQQNIIVWVTSICVSSTVFLFIVFAVIYMARGGFHA